MSQPASAVSSAVTTALYIGGKERKTADTMAIADPAKPGVVVGYAAAATTQVVIVTHSGALLEFLDDRATRVELVKESGATSIAGQGLLNVPAWNWGSR